MPVLPGSIKVYMVQQAATHVKWENLVKLLQKPRLDVLNAIEDNIKPKQDKWHVLVAQKENLKMNAEVTDVRSAFKGNIVLQYLKPTVLVAQ